MTVFDMRRNIVSAVFSWSMYFVSMHPMPAHAGMDHSGMHMDESMARQHKMMAMYASTEPKIKESLKKQDAGTSEAEIRKILTTIPALRKTSPHKNLSERKELDRIAGAFEKDLEDTLVKVKRKDFAGARKSFSSAEKKCIACHARFRD